MIVFRITLGLIVFGWLLSSAWLGGSIVGYTYVISRERRRRKKINAEHRRIAEDFARWERDHIEWQRKSEGKHPSRWP